MTMNKKKKSFFCTWILWFLMKLKLFSLLVSAAAVCICTCVWVSIKLLWERGHTEADVLFSHFSCRGLPWWLLLSHIKTANLPPFLFLSTDTGWPITSTSNVRPQASSCTPWRPASARRSICTASGHFQWTRMAKQLNTTTTTPWSTSTPPAPVLTPCPWSSGRWARCTDRGRSGSTQGAVRWRTAGTRFKAVQHFPVTACLVRTLYYYFLDWFRNILTLNKFMAHFFECAKIKR